MTSHVSTVRLWLSSIKCQAVFAFQGCWCTRRRQTPDSHVLDTFKRVCHFTDVKTLQVGYTSWRWYDTSTVISYRWLNARQLNHLTVQEHICACAECRCLVYAKLLTYSNDRQTNRRTDKQTNRWTASSRRRRLNKLSNHTIRGCPSKLNNIRLAVVVN